MAQRLEKRVRIPLRRLKLRARVCVCACLGSRERGAGGGAHVAVACGKRLHDVFLLLPGEAAVRGHDADVREKLLQRFLRLRNHGHPRHNVEHLALPRQLALRKTGPSARSQSTSCGQSSPVAQSE